MRPDEASGGQVLVRVDRSHCSLVPAIVFSSVIRYTAKVFYACGYFILGPSLRVSTSRRSVFGECGSKSGYDYWAVMAVRVSPLSISGSKGMVIAVGPSSSAPMGVSTI